MHAGAARATMAPKLGAAAALAAAAAAAPLGATALFSSVAALLGAPGQATYAAANGALEAWAAGQAGRGAPWPPCSGAPGRSVRLPRLRMQRHCL